MIKMECLSKKFINNKSILLWRCSKEHEWNATFNNIKNNTWCPCCATNNLVHLKMLNKWLIIEWIMSF